MLETLMVTFEEACPTAFPSLLLEYFALTDCQSHGEPASEILCQLSKVIFGGARKETTGLHLDLLEKQAFFAYRSTS